VFASIARWKPQGRLGQDLRGDRPVLVVPGSPGVGGDSRREQAFRQALRGLAGTGGSFRRPLAGRARDVDVRECDCCLNCNQQHVARAPSLTDRAPANLTRMHHNPSSQ
jgi:hypothetical protein